MAFFFILAFLICQHAEFLAAYILMEPRCAPFLPIMGISVPFAALHACINGYYYGTQKANVPAFSQVAEQVSAWFVSFCWPMPGWRQIMKSRYTWLLLVI